MSDATPNPSDYDRDVKPQPDMSALINSFSQGPLALNVCSALPVTGVEQASLCAGAGVHHGLQEADRQHERPAAGVGVRLRLAF